MVHSHSKGEEQHPPSLYSYFSFKPMSPPLFCDPFSPMFSPSYIGHSGDYPLTIVFWLTGQPQFDMHHQLRS